MKKRSWLLWIFTALSLFLSGCGGGSSNSNYAAQITAETAVETAAAAMDMGAVNSAAMAPMPTAMPESADEYKAVEYEGEMDASSLPGGAAEASVTQTALPQGRKLIRTMDLNVETVDFDSLLNAVQAKVSQLEGYIERSDISGNSITNYGRPSLRYASIVLRIPADRLDAFIAQVETDSNVTYKSENVSDVTLEYSDVESRLKTLRMEQERLWELLAQADSTESILALEQRLTDVSIEIETSESRLRHLDNSVIYSTVYLNINEVDLESPTQPETTWQQIQRGFAQNITALGDALTIFLIRFISSLPTLLFLLAVVLVVFLIIRQICKRICRKKKLKTEENPANDLQTSETTKSEP